MASKGQYGFLITATLLVFFSSPASICVAAYQGNPHGFSISTQTGWPGNDPDVTTSQTGLRVPVPSVNQGPDSKAINDNWNEPYAASHEETSPLLSGTATDSNPNNRLIAQGLPSTRIDTEKEVSPSPWMYSVALVAFVLYARRRGSV